MLQRLKAFDKKISRFNDHGIVRKTGWAASITCITIFGAMALGDRAEPGRLAYEHTFYAAKLAEEIRRKNLGSLAEKILAESICRDRTVRAVRFRTKDGGHITIREGEIFEAENEIFQLRMGRTTLAGPTKIALAHRNEGSHLDSGIYSPPKQVPLCTEKMEDNHGR